MAQQQIVSIDRLYPLILNVGYSRHHADWNWKNISSPFFRIFYIVSGEAQLHISDDTYILKPGYMYCIPSFVNHSYSCDGDFSLYYLHVYTDNSSRSDVLENFTPPIEIEACDMDLTLIKRLCEMNPTMQLSSSNPASYDNNITLKENLQKNRQRALSDRIESRGILFMLISRLLRYSSVKTEAQDERIQRAVTYIKDNISKMINIDDLADEACLSKDHLIRLFKKQIGESPLQYINRKKMERAQLLLLTESAPVKNVAYMLGYDDHSYFIRIFKKHTGLSPMEYRKQHF